MTKLYKQIEFVDGGTTTPPLKIGTRRIGYAASAPTTGTWVKGDFFLNNNPSALSVLGWRCATAGTPGTWEAIAANQYMPLFFTFSSNYQSEIVIHESLYLNCNAPLIKSLGGTFTIKKALAASPAIFSIVTGASESFASGDILRVELIGSTFNPGVPGQDLASITIKRV